MDPNNIMTHPPGGGHAHDPDHMHMHHHHHQHDATSKSEEIHDSGDKMMMMMMDMNHMMSRFFTTKTHDFVLFEHVQIDSISGIAIAMVSVVLAVILFEIINYSLNLHSTSGKTKTWTMDRLLLHGLLTLMKMLSVLMGYIIMLCVMTYNVWIMASVVLGFGVSHLVVRPIIQMYFSWRRKTDQIEVPSNDVNSTQQELLHDYETDCIHSNSFEHNENVIPVRYKKIDGKAEVVSLVKTSNDRNY